MLRKTFERQVGSGATRMSEMERAFVFLGLVDPAPISAQQASATVNGIITDPTSAVVEGASIVERAQTAVVDGEDLTPNILMAHAYAMDRDDDIRDQLLAQ